MDVETRYKICSRNLQEIITTSELHQLLETNNHPRGYVGFECSGMMHAGTGLIVGKKMLDYVEAGFEFIIFLADWHSWINNKLGGNMDNIRIGGEYFKDCFSALGLPEGKVHYMWASELVEEVSYWEKIVRVMKASSLKRILRSMPIMGRSVSQNDVESAWALYPAMQACDIFQMGLDVACSGIDQRKVHMLAREVAPKIGYKPPVCLHSPLLPGLQVTENEGTFDEDENIDLSIKGKMSKSIAKGAIWLNDTPEDIREKYEQAYCPAKIVEGNPILDHTRMVVFPHLGVLEIKRPEKYGGDIYFDDFEELAKVYAAGGLHPLDLKKAVGEAFIDLLKPVRDYFKTKPDNLEKMRQLKITR